MADPFERVTLLEFAKEEQAAVQKIGDVGMMTAMMMAGKVVLEYTTQLTQSATVSGIQKNSRAAGKDTAVRAFAYLVVSGALAMREYAARLGVVIDDPEIDLLVNWYRNRWAR